MPEMDSTEAMRRIRAQAGGANTETPVVCFTADAVDGAREFYLSEGFTDYLPKPVDGKALEKLLLRYLPGEKVQMVQLSPGGEPGEAPVLTVEKGRLARGRL